jgi:hypothetical protein
MTTAEHLDQLLAPLSRCLTPEAAERIVLMRPDPRLQARLNELAAGGMTADEVVEYEAYVKTGDVIATLQAKARTFLAAG